MSNMINVKSALTAEIKHAKEGIAFYSTRIAALEKMLQQIDRIDGSPGAVASLDILTDKKPVRVAKDASDNSDAGNAGSGSNPAKGNEAKLPPTTAKFWQSLLSETPISNKDIIKGALAALKIRPGPIELKKLNQRLANAITIMTKDGTMLSEGTGRERRFFIKKP